MSRPRVSWIELALLAAIVAMLVVIARPELLRGPKPRNEAEAASALLTLARVEVVYSSRRPAQGFTCSLSELYEMGFIDARVASGAVAGYRLTAGTCRPSAPDKTAITEYQWFADPVSNATGTRHFCLDQSGVVRASVTDSGPMCLVNGTPLPDLQP